jgi:hypothetical protein
MSPKGIGDKAQNRANKGIKHVPPWTITLLMPPFSGGSKMHRSVMDGCCAAHVNLPLPVQINQAVAFANIFV